MAAKRGVVLLLYAIWYCMEAFFKTCIDLFVPSSFRRLKDVKGEIVLITGGGAGLGRHLAIGFAKRRATVVIWDVNQHDNVETARMIRELDAGDVYAYTVDVSKADQVYAAAERVRQEVGDVTMLVNNAGIAHYKPVLECSEEVVQRTVDVNAVSHFWLHKAFLPAMKAQNSGHIVTIGSIIAYAPYRSMGAYTSSKCTVIGIHESLQLDLAYENSAIKLTLACPSGLATGMILGRINTGGALLSRPDDAAEEIIEGVLLEKRVLCVPSSAYFMTIVKNLIPVKLMVMLLRSVNLENTFVEDKEKSEGGTDGGGDDDDDDDNDDGKE
ncbi:estradiol 17-beta-dehydrogenase 11-like [Acanthaster planci]|uniref:Short-chain dehydrogenase/reductase 3 n=1 Tax=Acanthaster planci TaxID=133434 RepID=A0A8B7ZXY5_ACAPL|nr:estradiol 17-beta-dehydrogenase 11-like [Acanthaster planci]